MAAAGGGPPPGAGPVGVGGGHRVASARWSAGRCRRRAWPAAPGSRALARCPAPSPPRRGPVAAPRLRPSRPGRRQRRANWDTPACSGAVRSMAGWSAVPGSSRDRRRRPRHRLVAISPWVLMNGISPLTPHHRIARGWWRPVPWKTRGAIRLSRRGLMVVALAAAVGVSRAIRWGGLVWVGLPVSAHDPRSCRRCLPRDSPLRWGGPPSLRASSWPAGVAGRGRQGGRGGGRYRGAGGGPVGSRLSEEDACGASRMGSESGQPLGSLFIRASHDPSVPGGAGRGQGGMVMSCELSPGQHRRTGFGSGRRPVRLGLASPSPPPGRSGRRAGGGRWWCRHRRAVGTGHRPVARSDWWHCALGGGVGGRVVRNRGAAGGRGVG